MSVGIGLIRRRYKSASTINPSTIMDILSSRYETYGQEYVRHVGRNQIRPPSLEHDLADRLVLPPSVSR